MAGHEDEVESRQMVIAGREVTVTQRKKALEMPGVEEWDWYQAVPLALAAELWPVNESTVRRWAVEGKVASWKPGTEWFVSALSMKRLCGSPKDERRLLEILPSLT